MSALRKLVIAIDGPAGSGKSTIAARVARALGYINLESGAMYRALALEALERHLDLDDPPAVTGLAREIRIELQPLAEGNRVLLNGRDVSQRIRESDVTLAASRVSVHPSVRQILVARQREMGAGGGVVMEGRDIGTAVFPGAEVKIFLDADPSVRAERRILQNDASRSAAANAATTTQARVSPGETHRVAAEIAARDQRDRQRAASPLIAAPDAVTIDTTTMSIDEVVSAILALVGQKLNHSQTLSS